MGRPRKHDKHLPSNFQHRHGAYYYVRQGKWTRLAGNYSDALEAYARLIKTTGSGTLAAALDRMIKAKSKGKKKLAPRSLDQYKSAAKRLKEVFPGFNVEDVKPRNV